MPLLELVYVAAVGSFTTAAAISDLRTRRLPNWLTVPAFAAAVLMHTVVNGLAGLGFSLLGFATGFGLLLILWLIGGGGGGDVKLMGALGAWLGVSLTLCVFLISALIAAVVTVAALLAGMLSRSYGYVNRRYLATGSAGRLAPRRPGDEDSRQRRQVQRRVLPYAVPVALGTWFMLALAWTSSRLPW
jgi:prepilin peptidase CpaA